MPRSREPSSARGRYGAPTRSEPSASQRNLVDRENSQHHSDDDESHKYPHGEDDHGLEQPERALEIGPDLGLERLGDLDEHVLETARLLADSHHVDRQHRKRRL